MGREIRGVLEKNESVTLSSRSLATFQHPLHKWKRHLYFSGTWILPKKSVINWYYSTGPHCKSRLRYNNPKLRHGNLPVRCKRTTREISRTGWRRCQPVKPEARHPPQRRQHCHRLILWREHLPREPQGKSGWDFRCSWYLPALSTATHRGNEILKNSHIRP